MCHALITKLMNLIEYKVISIEIHIIHSLHIFVIFKVRKMQKMEGNVVFSFGKMHVFLITRYIMSCYNWIFFYVVVKECSIFQFALLNKIPIFSIHGQPPYSYTLGEFIMNTFKSSSSISRIKKT